MWTPGIYHSHILDNIIIAHTSLYGSSPSIEQPYFSGSSFHVVRDMLDTLRTGRKYGKTTPDTWTHV